MDGWISGYLSSSNWSVQYATLAAGGRSSQPPRPSTTQYHSKLRCSIDREIRQQKTRRGIQALRPSFACLFYIILLAAGDGATRHHVVDRPIFLYRYDSHHPIHQTIFRLIIRLLSYQLQMMPLPLGFEIWVNEDWTCLEWSRRGFAAAVGNQKLCGSTQNDASSSRHIAHLKLDTFFARITETKKEDFQ